MGNQEDTITPEPSSSFVDTLMVRLSETEKHNTVEVFFQGVHLNGSIVSVSPVSVYRTAKKYSLYP